MSRSLEINLVIEAAYKAGAEILKIYNSTQFDIEIKGDNSPLTKADKAAHQVIVKYLEKTSIPLLSEEGEAIPYKERKKWNRLWMVDPLDGTKEFIKRNGEFTVNIALIENGNPIFGVVYAPVLDKLFYGGIDLGAFVIHNKTEKELKKQKQTSSITKIVASRSHLNEETKKFIEEYENYEIVSMGSSLKFMILAEGNADVYPRFAPTMEWDTAAAHAIIKPIGFKVIDPKTKKALVYNKANLLNPYFLVS